MYTLKVAVVDEEGKRGSVERTFQARINGFGQLHVTDLLIADNSVRGTDGLPPAVAADFAGDEIHQYVELFSDVPEQLKNATVMMEVAQDEASRALDSTPARFQQVQAGGDRRRVAEAGVPIALLPPGEYVARAVISVNGRKVGQVVRPFRVTRAAAAMAAPGAATVPMKASAPIAFTSRIDAFDKSAVLTPQVMGFFLDRMSAAAAADAAAVRPAIDSVRAGKFDEAMAALKDSKDDQLAAVFLKGIVLLHSGDLQRRGRKIPRRAAHGLGVFLRRLLPRRLLRRRRQGSRSGGRVADLAHHRIERRRLSTPCSATRCSGCATWTRRSTSSPRPAPCGRPTTRSRSGWARRW